jgi:diguanylate cyclase (GGDEF)-like protein
MSRSSRVPSPIAADGNSVSMEPESEHDELPELLDRVATELSNERAARRREQALVRSAQALSSTLDLDEVLGVILGQLRSVVPYDTASVQELRDGAMVVVAGSGIDLDFFGGMRFDATPGNRPNGDVFATKAPLILDDVRADHGYADFPHPAHVESGARAWLGVPLLFGDECVGMITLDSFEVAFYTDEHAQTALAFASQAAVALENARAYERVRHEVEERRRAEDELREANENLTRRMAEIETLQESLREQALRDPLTGLFNRRYLMETVQREIERCRRDDCPLSVVLFDVDHFKAVNDSLGHEAGDQILVAVSRYLQSQVRSADVACRYGGEEFVVVLADTPLDVAIRRAEEWRVAMREIEPHVAGRRTTVSVGVAAAPDHGDSADEVIRAADEAMYAAKAAGRDRVVAAGS